MVSAELEPFAKLNSQGERNKTTSIQRVLLPWLISKYGASYKRVKLDVLKQMVSAIIDMDNLLDLGSPCEDVAKTYAIGFRTVVKRTKLAAGLSTFMHLAPSRCGPEYIYGKRKR